MQHTKILYRQNARFPQTKSRGRADVKHARRNLGKCRAKIRSPKVDAQLQPSRGNTRQHSTNHAANCDLSQTGYISSPAHKKGDAPDNHTEDEMNMAASILTFEPQYRYCAAILHDCCAENSKPPCHFAHLCSKTKYVREVGRPQILAREAPGSGGVLAPSARRRRQI